METGRWTLRLPASVQSPPSASSLCHVNNHCSLRGRLRCQRGLMLPGSETYQKVLPPLTACCAAQRLTATSPALAPSHAFNLSSSASLFARAQRQESIPTRTWADPTSLFDQMLPLPHSSRDVLSFLTYGVHFDPWTRALPADVACDSCRAECSPRYNGACWPPRDPWMQCLP